MGGRNEPEYPTIADVKNVGISKEVCELSQSFSYSLSKFLRRPNISRISPGTELYQGQEYDFTRLAMRGKGFMNQYTTYKRTTTEITIDSPYIVDLEIATGAILTFLEKIFEQRAATIQLQEMSKNESPRISYRVRID